jgi:tetratricopeptide (TPR) repeat protein
MPDNLRIDDLRRRVQKDPASIAFAQLGEEYRRAGQYAESADVCRAGLVIHPGYLSARVTLGRTLIELGDLDAARRELEIVLGGARDNLSAIRGLAEIHHRQGDIAAALSHYQRALSLAPNDPDLEETVADLTRQLESKARVELEEDHGAPPDAERDRAGRIVGALEEFLASIHAAGANRRS